MMRPLLLALLCMFCSIVGLGLGDGWLVLIGLVGSALNLAAFMGVTQ